MAFGRGAIPSPRVNASQHGSCNGGRIRSGAGSQSDRKSVTGNRKDWSVNALHQRIPGEVPFDQGGSHAPDGHFRKRGAVDGEIAHYLRADGTGGFTIAENDDLASVYADVLLYSEYMTFSVTPVLKVDDALAPIFAYIGE
jgi:hypothetical protein